MSFSKAVVDANLIGRTENGAKTFTTTKNAVVDFFYNIGAVRANPARGVDMFNKAAGENHDMAVRIALWARDVRGGAGEREAFRHILRTIEVNDPVTAEKLIPIIPEVGRWDDLLSFETDRLKTEATAYIGVALSNGHGLAAKWMPRKGVQAADLRKRLGMSPKAYRKMLVGLTNVVETPMCSKEWETINLEHVPSLAMARYRKAFQKHLGASFEKFTDKVLSGEAKINTGAVYPYDVLKNVRYGGSVETKAIMAQWENLPNYLGDSGFVLPLIDVSGSMGFDVKGSKGGKPLMAMDVAVSLGLYLADKQTGPFKDLTLTFESNPKFVHLRGNIVEKARQIYSAPWGGSTDIEAAFREIMRVAVSQKVAPEDMPKYLLILSDMEFNSCTRNRTGFETLRDLYSQAGYELPTVVFWNLASRNENFPVLSDQKGAVLVSGFSPAIAKAILGMDASNIDPYNLVIEAVCKDRYDWNK